MLPAIPFLALPALVGFILITGLWPGGHTKSVHRVLKISLGIAIGLGICSINYFLWIVLGKPRGNTVIVMEIVVLAGIIAWYICSRAGHPHSSEYRCNAGQDPFIQRMVCFAFYVTLVGGVTRFILLSLKSPHGYIDAWAIYNLKAKFLLEGNSLWRNAFSESLSSHPDYPLLVSANVARGWEYFGETTVLVPIVVAMTFTFLTVGILVSSVTVLRGSPSQGYLAGIVLLGALSFINIGAYQYADVPFALFCLATIACFALYDKSECTEHTILFIAGLAAGLATWTKNEGWLFVLSIMIGRFLAVSIYSEMKLFLRQGLTFLQGLVPVLAVVIYFKMFLAPPGDLVGSQELQDVLARLLESSRYQEIAAQLVRHMVRLAGWPVPILVILFYHLLCLGIAVNDWQKVTLSTGALTLLFVLIGYFFIYVISPHPLSWHLNASLIRLLQHLWPSILLLYFLIVRAPDDWSHELHST